MSDIYSGSVYVQIKLPRKNSSLPL